MTSTKGAKNCYPLLGMVTSSRQTLSDETKTWLVSSEAADFLGISVQALMNHVSNGKIPYYKFGRRNRYLRSELESVLKSEPRGQNGNKIRI
jgi:excisionase family DNA binding protein